MKPWQNPIVNGRLFASARFILLLAAILFPVPPALAADPPPYVPATAYHILPHTTSEESGYFSLSDSQDGKIHVGTAKYNANAYLVEFDPRTGRQSVVLDVNKTCGLTATGYAAQAKLHTRNFVGPSGKVYVGSKQGYAAKGDTSQYPGGYVMIYDPRNGKAENLGMPFPGQGVIDVTADEARDLLYVVTCEDQHWMLGRLAGAPWRELGPMLTPYAMTLVDGRGVASALTKDFQLAQYDPAADKVTTRPIHVDGKLWTRANGNSIPTWQLDPDGRHAWLILMNDPTLLRIDLHTDGPQVNAQSRGLMLEGKHPDSRCALTIHPDGKIYALIRIDNATGFGAGYLHHLVRYDPKANKHEDLGVLKVQNPDYFDFKPGPDGKQKQWTHGFHTLPDGSLTPLHAHMALMAARDGAIYATIIYPFTLLKVDAYKLPPAAPTPASRYLDSLQNKLDETQTRIPEITRIAEQIADRHLKGGIMGFPWIGTTLEQELFGRSGGLMHISFDRAWKKDRTPEEKAMDVAIFSWDDAPRPGDLKSLLEYKKKGMYVLGFGPRRMKALAEHVAACDAWIDTGAGDEDRVIELPGGKRVGKTNHFVNVANGWVFIGEFVAALTRRGKMPTMWKSWAAGGRDWSDKYFLKTQFHDEFQVPPLPAGQVGTLYLQRIGYMIQRMKRVELPQLRRMAMQISDELKQGRKTIIASTGHMAMNYLGRYDDALWGVNHETHDNVEAQLKSHEKSTPDDALVLRLDYFGLHRSVHELFQRKKQRVMLITCETLNRDFRVPPGYDLKVDAGFGFGDAVVWLPGYPIPILPASGLMQVAPHEAINVEVHAMQPR